MNDTNRALVNCISAEIEALMQIKNKAIPSIIDASMLLLGRTGDIITTGVGKSGYVCMKMAATLTSLDQKAFFMHPTEALHGDMGMIRSGDVVIALSNSGNSSEIVKLLKILKKRGDISVLGITGNRDSFLGREAHMCIVYDIQNEGCHLGVAPMASTTAALSIGDMLAVALSHQRQTTREDFAKHHPGGSLGLALQKVHERMMASDDMSKVPPHMSLLTTVDAINKTKQGIAAVTDADGHLMGSISDGDIRRAVGMHRNFNDLTAETIMHTTPHTISKDSSLSIALKKMEQLKITSLFVVDEEVNLVGLIHMHHILDDADF